MRDISFIDAQMIGARRRDPRDRERLADAAHLKHCAKHKGRNHWRNWERRKMFAEKKRLAAEKVATKLPAQKAFAAACRAYWAGERETHPAPHPLCEG